MHEGRDERDERDEQAATVAADAVAEAAAGAGAETDAKAGSGEQGAESKDEAHDETQGEAQPDTEAESAEVEPEPADPTDVAGADDSRLAAEYYDRLVRLQAEFDNYRKRMQRERESDVKYAGERFVQAMLPVLDNFERALATIPEGEQTQAWRQGIVMIQRQLFEVLEKEGVSVVVADPGTAFDPHQHEAVLYEDSDEYGEGQIIGELQRGYRLHDRLIRPSLVRVARQG